MARAHARRFMLPGAGKGSTSLGYTGQPIRELPLVADEPAVVERIAEACSMRDEPEAPSEAWLDAAADLAFMRNQQARLADIAQAQGMRPLLSLEQRMMDAQRRAKLQHVDCRSEFTAVRRMLEAARLESERRGARTVRAAERRLERVEVRLDQLPGDMAA
jgi:hypothetical protein